MGKSKNAKKESNTGAPKSKLAPKEEVVHVATDVAAEVQEALRTSAWTGGSYLKVYELSDPVVALSLNQLPESVHMRRRGDSTSSSSSSSSSDSTPVRPVESTAARSLAYAAAATAAAEVKAPSPAPPTAVKVNPPSKRDPVGRRRRRGR